MTDVKHREPLEVSGQALIDACRDLPSAFAACRRLVSETTKDGYPTSSLNTGGPASVLDDQGVPMPPLSDPVGELATEPVEANPALNAYRRAKALERRAIATAKRAEREADEALSLLRRATAAPKDEPEAETDDTDLWCSICIKVSKPDGTKVMNPTASAREIHKGEQPKARCSECDDWAVLACGDPVMPKERPPALILLKEHNGKLTTADVDGALEEARCKRSWPTAGADHSHECRFTKEPAHVAHACRWCDELIEAKRARA